MSLPWPNWTSEEWRKQVRVNRAASSEETLVHEAADAHVKKLSVALRYAFSRGRKAVGHGKPNVTAAVRAIENALEDVLPSMLAKVVVDGGKAAVKLMPETRSLADDDDDDFDEFDFTFDSASEFVVEWARKHAAELVTGVTETTRGRLRRIITRLSEEGDWDSARDDIEKAIGDEDRAELIARHESMSAASFGQREAWRQATEAGYLPEDAKRTWIAVGDEKTCPICSELDGQVVGLDELYNGEFEGPPAHVACRCTEGIVG